MTETGNNQYENDPIRSVPWMRVTDQYGRLAAYVDLRVLSEGRMLRLEEALQDKGIEYEIKETSLTSSYPKVIAITGDHIDKLNNHLWELPPQGTVPPPAPQTVLQQLQSFFARAVAGLTGKSESPAASPSKDKKPDSSGPA